MAPPQGPVYYDYTQYSGDYFADNYAEYYNLKWEFSKVLSDSVIPLDYMTIEDGSTFEDVKVLATYQSAPLDLAAVGFTRPVSSSNTGTSDLLLPFNFTKGINDFVLALDLIRIQQPLRPDRDNPQTVSQIDDDIYNFNKVLASSAIPLDYMTIDDGSTFSEVKPLYDFVDAPISGSGRDNYALNYFDDPYFYAFRLVPIFEFNKVLADTVIPLDYMTIEDGSTFAEIKVLATYQSAPIDRISNIAATKVLMSEQPGVEDNGNVFNFNKVLADFQLTRQGPGENDSDDYVPDWADPAYIDDGRAVFSLFKVLSDSVITLDYMTIADGSTFEDIKVLSSVVSALDNGDVFSLTKPLSDTYGKFEGPRQEFTEQFSPDYFLDDYTENFAPIWNLSKVLTDSVIPLDYMTIVDGSTFSDIKSLPPEYVNASSFSVIDWVKTKVETLVASDVLLPFMVELAKFDSVAPPPQGPVYYDYTKYSPDYFADDYAEYYNLKYSFDKVLYDSVIPLDYMTIADGSTFSDVKILSSINPAPADAIANYPQKVVSSNNTTSIDTLLPFTFVKGLSDFVSTLDNLSISQPYSLDRYTPQKVYQLDDDIFNLNKYLISSVTNEDYGTLYTFNKVLSDSVRAKEGPGDNTADDYVNTWTDPNYIEDGRPVYNYIKVLPADYVTALDYMTIADGSTFADVKVLNDFVSDVSENVFNFNKRTADSQPVSDTLLSLETELSKRDSVTQPQGPVYYNKAGYSPDFFNDDYTEFFGPKYSFIKVLPADYVTALDYMTIVDGSMFADVKPLFDVLSSPTDASTRTPTKALADSLPSQPDGNYHDQNSYAADYFVSENVLQYTVEYRPTIVFNKALADIALISLQGPTFNFSKPLSSSTNGMVTGGIIAKNNYVSEAFFATDFVGTAYALS